MLVSEPTPIKDILAGMTLKSRKHESFYHAVWAR